MTLNVSHGNSGDFVGTVVECPIVVQGESVDAVKKNAVNALALYFLHHGDETTGKFTQS